MDNEESKNLKNNEGSDGEDDDENKKKPPAQEMVVSFPTRTSVGSSQSSSPSSSGETSAASISTAMTPSLSSRPSLVLATPGSKTPVVRKRTAKSDTSTSPLSFLNLQDEIYYLSGTALIAFFAFTYVVLPATALLALSVFCSSVSMLIYTSYTNMRAEFDALLQGRGLGDYLPESLYRTLTQQTLHEYMTDPTFGLENRHLLLYFLPLSNEQRDAFIARLAPHHRNALQRQGLGHFFGDGFMRLIMGQERWQATAAVATSNTPAAMRQVMDHADDTPRTTSTTGTPARLLFDNDDDSRSDLGLHVEETDLAGGLSEEAASGMLRRLVLAERATNGALTDATVILVPQQQEEMLATGEDEERELQAFYDEELNVLIEAFFNAVNDTVLTPLHNYVADTVSQLVRPATESIVRYGFGLSLFTGGLGLVGYWRGAFGLNRATSRRTLWVSVALGGTSIGVALFAHSLLRPMSPNTEATNEKSSSTTKPHKSEK